uniref:Uncharacterized protein n=1 Tax=Globisporangium ultimum (strain ATCC 200006 / CBS 805.95 / DAOM BR144) TaxID=431595 RepID=K3WTI0_GLOUD
MLRDQGTAFKDVTIPYWNYFQDHNMNMARQVPCDSMLTCSQFLQDLGGSSTAVRENGYTIASSEPAEGYRVSSGIARYACPTPFSVSGNCNGFIVRGDWSNTTTFLPVLE